MKLYATGTGKYLLMAIMLLILQSCLNKSSSENHIGNSSRMDSINKNGTITGSLKPTICGHVWQDTIIGNLTGHGLDSIWIKERADTAEDGLIEYNYHTESSNPRLPSVELYGRSSHCAFIVNEGDLDGDGKDEWAWMRGAFKSNAFIEYHLLHYNGKTWKEFLCEMDDDTRNSDTDFARKGPVAGSIVISFLYWPEKESPNKTIGYDTIFNPFTENPLLHK